MNREYIIMVLCMLISFSCHGQNPESMEASIYKKLYPYLGSNDLYGYADSEGNVLIEPQYNRVDFFHNGVAIVRKEGEKEKLIDLGHQEIPIPLKYEELRQHSFSDHTIIELKNTYTNRWRFWEWRFLPDFSFMGTSSRNRLFDIEVMREKRTLYWLEGQRIIQSKRGSKGKESTYFYLNAINDNTIQVDEAFYSIDHQTIKRTVKNVSSHKIVNGGYYLQQKKGFFRMIDSTGTPISSPKFLPQLEMELEIEGAPVRLATESHSPTRHRSADVYKDSQGNTYIYPDLSMKFPQKISPYPFQDSITAIEILKRTQSFAPIPDSDRFLLVLDFGRKVFTLDTAGNWQDPEESKGKITVVSGAGDILWPAYQDELGTLPLPEGWRIISFRAFSNSQDSFRVSLHKDGQGVHGIWDRSTASWIMPPEYHWIGYRPYNRKFLSFQTEKDGKWGVYDLVNQQVHIPPAYDYINDSGWVRLYENEILKEFYLDIDNKREFREKRL